jgi:predicted ATPase/DNA-binding CsgD family transcriptional regulator
VSAGADWEELTARESAVLAAVERRLNNAEIAAEFFISVRTVESHIAALRRKLGVDSRAKLISAARSLRRPAVAVPRNSFVGRGTDLETVRTLLDQQYWVTVLGPAGCGKTRLSLELAAADERVPVVAELEHAAPADVVGVVARAIGLGADSAGDLIAACGIALAAQRYLLVLDNCDRVTEAVGALVRKLLTLTGSLTVLATSRSPIGGSDETIYQLLPLRVDDDSAGEGVGTGEAAVAAGGAVDMFIDRARSAAPTQQFSAEDVELIAAICRRLDGLPLAIELAAARVRHLRLPELAARLDEGFGPLDRAGPVGRHRTLEAAFDWTWDLLDADERWMLSRLAALPRTFDLELAEAVTEPGAGSIVLRLLDRSLVSPSGLAIEPRRFRLLDSLREFVLDRTSPEVAGEVRLAHLAYHAALAARLAKVARLDDSREAVERAKAICPEVNAALDWAIVTHHELALPLARALSIGVEQYGPDIDSLDSIARAARDPAVRAQATAPALLDIGIALCYGDLDLVGELADAALDMATLERDRLAAHHLAGYADAYRQRGEAALEHLAIAERLADRRLDMWELASVRQGQGIALRGLADPGASLAAFESSMHAYALAGDTMHVNNTRYMMASVAVDLEHFTDQAVAWAEECAAYARGSGNDHELAHAMLTRATLRADGDADAALFEAVRILRGVGDLRCLTRSYLQLARRRPASEQPVFLEQALDVATRAHDVANQAMALESLVRAHWDADAHREAARAFGALTNVIGYGQATSRIPEALVAELDHWKTAVAEGQARGLSTAI